MAKKAKKGWGSDPRDRWHVLAQAVEEDHEGEIIAIERWPTGDRPSRLFASGDTVEEVTEVIRMRTFDVSIVAHTTLESRVPCVMVACKPPEVWMPTKQFMP